jgi:hypothetical protein
MTPGSRVLTIVACGAGPAAAISTCVTLAQDRGWTVQVIATPAALEFFDAAAITDQTGSQVRSQYAKPGATRSLIPDAILVAPATGVLAETTGLAVPTVVLPFVNTALAARAPFRRSVESLRAEGVQILLGPGGFQPHPPRTGGSLIDSYPWHLGINEAERALDPATHNPQAPAE